MLAMVVSLSCSELRHYQKVASDDDPTPKELATISPFVATYFPAKVEYLPGDTLRDTTVITNNDTTYYTYNDTVYVHIKRTDTVKVKTTVIDTIVKIDPGPLNACRNQLNMANANWYKFEESAKDYKAKWDKSLWEVRRGWFIIAALGLVIVILVWQLIKKSIKPRL
jgi:hypothetical protein